MAIAARSDRPYTLLADYLSQSLNTTAAVMPFFHHATFDHQGVDELKQIIQPVQQPPPLVLSTEPLAVFLVN